MLRQCGWSFVRGRQYQGYHHHLRIEKSNGYVGSKHLRSLSQRAAINHSSLNYYDSRICRHAIQCFKRHSALYSSNSPKSAIYALIPLHVNLAREHGSSSHHHHHHHHDDDHKHGFSFRNIANWFKHKDEDENKNKKDPSTHIDYKQEAKEAQEQSQQMRTITWVGLGLNLLLASGKGIAGVVTSPFPNISHSSKRLPFSGPDHIRNIVSRWVIHKPCWQMQCIRSPMPFRTWYTQLLSPLPFFTFSMTHRDPLSLSLCPPCTCDGTGNIVGIAHDVIASQFSISLWTRQI